MGVEVFKRVEWMRIYSEQGRALSSILHLIGLKWATALKYARTHNIYFHDHKRRKLKDDAN